MEEDKRKVIVSEIENWRRSKLLPEQYCDFLINLYLPERADSSNKHGSVSASKRINSNWKAWTPAVGVVSLFILLIISLNSFQLPLHVAILGVFVCGVIWIATGIAAKKSTIHFAGWVLLLYAYGWFLQHSIGDFNWLGLQFCWVPISLALIWLGWLTTHLYKQVSQVLLIIGFIVWFVPDVYGLFFTDISQGILDVSMLLRIVIAAVFLYLLRKKWIEWVV